MLCQQGPGTHLQPRKSQCIQNQLTTSIMSEMGKLKRNQVPKFTTSAAGYWLKGKDRVRGEGREAADVSTWCLGWGMGIAKNAFRRHTAGPRAEETTLFEPYGSTIQTHLCCCSSSSSSSSPSSSSMALPPTATKSSLSNFSSCYPTLHHSILLPSFHPE